MHARMNCPVENAQLCADLDRDERGRVIPHVIAFDWKLMYAMVADIGAGRNWWSLWLSCIVQYHKIGLHSDAQISALTLLYPHFQEATMDFVQLMGIDYANALSCTCTNPFSDIIADGITVSCQVNELNLVAPFAADSQVGLSFKF